jgi:glycosyltransferase involved in cell wall biosynthesis
VWTIVVGDGPELERLQQLRDKYNAHNALRFVGHRADARQLLSAFDILWNGSLYEGQSNTILEAMSLGVPVVASDIPGNRDLVVENETGYLYPLGDTAKLTKTTNNLLRDPDRMQRLGDTSRRRVAEDFSLEKMVDSYENLYAQCCS